MTTQGLPAVGPEIPDERATARATRRWEEILDAAVQEFSDKGFKAARLRDIAGRVGLRTGSLYYYIESKEDLLAALVDAVAGPALELLVEVATDGNDARGRLRSFVQRYSALMDTRVATSLAVVQSCQRYLTPERMALVDDMRSGVESFVTGIVEQGIAEGHFDLAVDPVLAARTLLELLNSKRERTTDSPPYGSSSLAEWYTRLFLHGLGPTTGATRNHRPELSVRATQGRARPAGDLYWDPFDFELHADPHPTWRRMREQAPLYRNDEHDFWALTRFDDVLSALVDWRTYSSAYGDIIEVIQGGVPNDFVRSLLMEDPPAHTVHRQLMNRAFTPRAVRQIEDRVRGFVQRLLDERVGSGGFDFVDDFGGRVPGMVIAAMLGTPDEDLDIIRELTCAQIRLDEGRELDRKWFDQVSVRLGEYFMGHVRRRRKHPTDDIMSALVTMEFTDEHGVTRKLTDLEACQYIFLLSSAGNETAARFAGWAGATLALHPEERAKLVAHADLIPNAIEEILRYEPPSMALARVVTRDVVLHGRTVPEGAVMVLVNASTGRDQRRFSDPDTFNVERRIDRHLSFGFGSHLCMGVSLARLEARIVVEETLDRFPERDVEWDETELVHTGSAVRGYSKLPIVFN